MTYQQKYKKYKKKYIQLKNSDSQSNIQQEDDITYYQKKYHDLIKERLLKSVAPHQGNDFFFLTIPPGHPDAGKEVPVDWRLCSIVKYFWKKGLITTGWDQGGEYLGCFSEAFIVFLKNDINSKDAFDFLKKLLLKKFGEKNIITNNLEYEWKTEQEAREGVAKHNKFRKNFFQKNPDKILLENDPNANIVSIDFLPSMIVEIHDKLGIKIPDYTKRYPGDLIPYKPQ